MRKYLAFDIGGTNVKYGIVTDKGDIISRGSYETRTEVAEEFIEDIIKVYSSCTEKIEGIAIAMPGYIDSDNGVPVVCYAINCMEGKSIKNILQEKTGVRVEVENDANCVALAEKFNGNAIECSDFICVTVGTGIGGGIFCNNKILRGSKFLAGEFGFMITRGYKSENGMDTFSTNASTISLINRYKKYKGISQDINVDGRRVFEDRETDPEVDKLIKEWYSCLAFGILNLSATLNPEKILLGGAISIREDFIGGLKEALSEIPWWKDVSCELEGCKHKNDAGLIGAMYNFCNK